MRAAPPTVNSIHINNNPYYVGMGLIDRLNGRQLRQRLPKVITPDLNLWEISSIGEPDRLIDNDVEVEIYNTRARLYTLPKVITTGDCGGPK